MKNEEKSLINTGKTSFLTRIISFFKNLFKKEDVKIESSTINIEEDSIKNVFIENIKKIENEETKLLKLQQQYQSGEIAEEDLTEEQINKLCELYDKQIAELKKSNEIKRQKIMQYKAKYATEG